jgi:predicted polyphosphate/ATP-dependent NAD kinase
MVAVGIIANPVSARDIRRIVSFAGNLQISERANIILRVLSGLAKTGVSHVFMMPEKGGICAHLLRLIRRASKTEGAAFPQLEFLDMPITGSADDSTHAARKMRGLGVQVILVLGGDGTHRVVVSECGSIPVAGISTGTNNAFPETREPTITGIAIGLAATEQVPADVAYFLNKRFEVDLNDLRVIAIVDVAISAEKFVGARALWKTDSFRDLFVTFAEPHGIGMSSIVSLLSPLDRKAPYGKRVLMLPCEQADRVLDAPIAPGLIEKIGIGKVEKIEPGQSYQPCISSGIIALDGEREFTFSEKDTVKIKLRVDAFRTVDVVACMKYAAAAGSFVTVAEPAIGHSN